MTFNGKEDDEKLREMYVKEKFFVPSNPEIKLVWVGNLAAITSLLATIPFIAHITIQRTTHSISILWLILAMITCILWLIYGTVNKLQPTLISSSILFIGYIYLFLFKVIIEYKGLAEHQQRKK